MPRKTFKKVTTSEELLSKVNPDNMKLAEKFLREKNTRCSDLTIKNYKSDLDIFFVWNLNYNDNKHFTEIRKLEFSEFFSYVVEELQWGSARFSRMKSVLSSFSGFLEKYYDDEFPTFRNIINKVIESMPKNAVREKTVLSKEQVDGVLEYLSTNGMTQEACWFALAVASGSRFAELLRFTTDIIDENNVAFDGIFLETLRPIKSKGRTKTGKMITKYIIKDMFMPYYDAWLKERWEILKGKNLEHTSIFIDANGQPAKEHIVRIWVKNIEEHLGVPYYPHCTRHFLTTYLSQKGIPDALIQELFGWSDAKMVQIYTDTEVKDRKWLELANLKDMN